MEIFRGGFLYCGKLFLRRVCLLFAFGRKLIKKKLSRWKSVAQWEAPSQKDKPSAFFSMTRSPYHENKRLNGWSRNIQSKKFESHSPQYDNECAE